MLRTQNIRFFSGFIGLNALIFLRCSATFRFAPSSPSSSGNTNEVPRIVGGVETSIEHLPYLVNLRQNDRFSCGGAIISAQCILTAAHCVKNVPVSVLTVHAGSSTLSTPGVIAQVERSFVSSAYASSTLDMDVAILKLTIGLSGPNIVQIGICTASPSVGQYVQISGWGVTSEQNRLPADRVRTTNVPIQSTTECSRAYAGKAKITDTMFCASVPGERDSCSGDSGGPVVYGGNVCGIVSWGIGCGRARYPGVYTNVASARVQAFLNQVTKGNCV